MLWATHWIAYMVKIWNMTWNVRKKGMWLKDISQYTIIASKRITFVMLARFIGWCNSEFFSYSLWPQHIKKFLSYRNGVWSHIAGYTTWHGRIVNYDWTKCIPPETCIWQTIPPDFRIIVLRSIDNIAMSYCAKFSCFPKRIPRMNIETSKYQTH